MEKVKREMGKEGRKVGRKKKKVEERDGIDHAYMMEQKNSWKWKLKGERDEERDGKREMSRGVEGEGEEVKLKSVNLS